VLTIFCGLVLTFVYWTLSSAIRPLRDLTAAFVRVGARDYRERVNERGPLELVQLYQGFNQMVERLQQAEQQNQRLQEQLTTVQDEERADLARNLHDEIGPLLFAADVDAVAIERLANGGDAERIPERVGVIREAIGQMQRHVRDLLGRLRPAALLDMGLAHAIDNLASFWRAHRPNLNVVVQVPEEGFGGVLDGVLYRIVQESLSNAVRHGNPTTIEISVARQPDQSIAVSVLDDGSGLRANERPGGMNGGMGIVGMQERVASLGGALEVRNRSGVRGVAVTARLPAQMPERARPSRETPREISLQ
jgi:two-component system sensor histidine kinase UhpB